MRKFGLTTFLVFMLMLLFSSQAALGDWSPGDGHKMHFPQLPDEEGWNVNATQPLILADDWRCSETGWVKDIHFWGSWRDFDGDGLGDVGQIQQFVLSIHDDIPANPPDIPYSRPGETLWERDIYDFGPVPIDPPAMEGWMDPNGSTVIYNDHGDYWQYNIILPQSDWFPQEEGRIYWLNISAILQPDPVNNYQWGWKSTQDHWNDDAVWAEWGDLTWEDIFEPEDPNIDTFSIALDLGGQFVSGGGSGYVGGDPEPPSEPPWYYYQNTDWWNQWYYDGIFDPNRDKIVHIEFDADVYDIIMMPTGNLVVALNWSTPAWSAQGNPYPPIPPLSPLEEVMYIRREVLLATPLDEHMGEQHFSLDYIIRDYNPEWVSIDVQGYNFVIMNGTIEHTCVQSLDLAFVITGDNLDFGDAPDVPPPLPTIYPTLLANNGARHIIAGPWMGPANDAPDSEPDGQPTLIATGDDMDADGDDEDGLILPTLTAGQAVNFNLEVNNAPAAGAMVEIWIDYNIDNDWDDAGELAYSGLLPDGVNLITINVPAAAVSGTTFARGRISTAGTGSPRGQAPDGEVEDTEVHIEVPPPELDFGDAPDPPYPTWLASNGARHIIAGPFLDDGSGVDSPDAEPDGQPSANADGDDMDVDGDDEDGVTIPILTQGQPGNITYFVSGAAAGGGAVVQIWIDWNGDGVWQQPGEIVENALRANGGPYIVVVIPPANSVIGQTFLRARISTNGGLNPDGGPAADGEVEDHEVYIEPVPGKPLIEHSKWSQPPIEMDPTMDPPLFCGWDEVSMYPYQGFLWKMVADDYRCPGNMPVTSLHFWGSHQNWTDFVPPDLMGMDPPIIGWHIGFWSNVPAGWLAPWSSPEFLLHEVWVMDPARVSWEWVGYDEHPMYPMDSCFQYTLYLDETEYFWQGKHLDMTEDDVFWVSIAAIYSDTPPISPMFPWGWKTRPWSWMDDAITVELPDPGIPIDPMQVMPLIDEMTGESVDVAFELDTDPNYIKWEQHYTGIRNWHLYHDEPSYAEDPDGPDGPLPLTLMRLIADDWYCESKTPITAIGWWGSYWGYRYVPCMGPIARPQQPDYFQLRIWTDVPAGVDATYSHPGQVIWEYNAYEFDEVLVGYDKMPHDPGPPREPVFRYSVRLPEADWFCQEEPEQIFWLSVVAVYEFGPAPAELWGWTNHQHVFQDDAVDGNIDPGTGEWIWNELFDQEGNSQDMSFILYTEPGCFPCTHPDYFEWLRLGKPYCWCYLRQCHGDADDQWEHVLYHYYVYLGDLAILKDGWMIPEAAYVDPIQDPWICADFDHGWEHVLFHYRVYLADLKILKDNWMQPNLPNPDCFAGY